MDAQFVTSLEETLRKTLVPDSAVIKEAVQSLSKNFYDSPMALPGLVHILNNAQDVEMKQLSAVEARKLIMTNWSDVDASLKPAIRDSLVNTTFTAEPKLVRHSSARVVAAIGEIDLEAGEWQDLLPTLVTAVQDSNSQTREMAAYTLYTLLETQVPSLLPHVDDFLSLYSNLLVDPTSRDVRVNAVLALDVISQFIEEGEIVGQSAEKFKKTIPQMVEVLKEVITADESEMVRDVFNVLTSLIYLDSKLVGDHLVSLIQIVAELSANTQLDDEYRVFGLQFLISCVSMRKSKINSSKLGPTLTLLAAKIASEEIDVEEELSNEDEENENEENSPAALGLRLISQLASELPPSQILGTLFEALPNMISSSNQFERRAAFMCVSVTASGAPDFMSNHTEKIISWVCAGLQDPETLVRVASLRCLFLLTNELQDAVTDYHQQLLPLILSIIDGATSVVAYKYACHALDGLIEFMSHDAMGQYLEPLMNKLFQMLEQANSSILKTAIVSAIGSCAFASGKAFIPFFNTSVQLLEPFLSNAAEVEGMSDDDIELRAMTFENISTMARAVGSEAFSAYAKPLVEAAYNSVSSSNSRIRESGFAFISNMAKVYGAEFAGFLEQIVPEILKCLEQDEFTFGGSDPLEEDEDEDDENGGFNVHTGITIEKEIAALALAELAIGTGADFAKYVDVSIKTLEDQIENSYGMREAAMSCMFKIAKAMFNSTKGPDFKPPKGVPQQPYADASVIELMGRVRSAAIKILADEFELSMVTCILDSFADALSVCGPIAIIDNANDSASLEELCVQLMKLLNKEHPSQIDDEEEGAHDEEEDESSETATMLYDSALEILISLSLTLGPDFVKVFESFKDIIASNVNSKDKTMRVSSIGCLAEISAGLKEANPYSDELFKLFTDKLAHDKSLEVKSNAAYGVGIVVEHSTADLSSTYPTVLRLLFALLNKVERRQSKAEDEDSKEVINRSYANACGCVARMLLKNVSAVPLEHVVPQLISTLPLETGFEEYDPIFKLILRLYEIDCPEIVAATQNVVEVFAHVFQREAERLKLANESTLGREETLESSKQFSSEDLRVRVVELLKYLDQKFAGVVSANPILKDVIA